MSVTGMCRACMSWWVDVASVFFLFAMFGVVVVVVVVVIEIVILLLVAVEIGRCCCYCC